MNNTMPKHIGDYNKNQMLSILRQKGSASRAELSKLMGISTVAISRNINQLLDIGIIRECGEEKSSMGRKPVLLELCGSYCYVLGADIVGGTLKAALADLTGKIIEYNEETIKVSQGAQAVIKQLTSVLKSLIKKTGIDRKKIWAATIGTPGIFNAETGKSLFSFFVDHWEDINIQKEVKKALRIETIIDNDINLDVIGESWKGAGRNYKNILYVKIGQGLGARIVIDNKLLRGQHNMAGEIGFMLPDLSGKGQNYEQKLKNANLIKNYRILNGKSKASGISDLCTLAKNQDNAAKKVVKQLFDHLAILLLNCSTVLDPQIIILGGDACSLTDNELILIQNHMEEKFPISHKLILSTLEKKACIYGAIKTGLDYAEKRITELW